MTDPTINKNVSLWNEVSKTNPKMTKKVKLGREFTAIDPMSQIHEATKKFGPVGQGWGWDIVRVEYLPTNDLAVLVRLWHGTRDNYYEQWGQNGLFTNAAQSKADHDCFKKATTDGVTKCLSYLGFNADVFLGKFDDNRYVAQMNEEFAEENGKTAKTKLTSEHKGSLKTYISALEAVETQEQLDALGTDEFRVFWAMLKDGNHRAENTSLKNAYNLAQGRAKKAPAANDTKEEAA